MKRLYLYQIILFSTILLAGCDKNNRDYNKIGADIVNIYGINLPKDTIYLYANHRNWPLNTSNIPTSHSGWPHQSTVLIEFSADEWKLYSNIYPFNENRFYLANYIDIELSQDRSKWTLENFQNLEQDVVRYSSISEKEGLAIGKKVLPSKNVLILMKWDYRAFGLF